MIPVQAPQEPAGFDANCRIPGNAWLQANPLKDPHVKPLWTAFTQELRVAFGNRCGFLAMYIPRGTVDHWMSVKSRRELAYEWSNYRYMDHGLNSAKKPGWEGQLLDPFEVGDDWFEIQLPSLQLVVAHIPDAATRARAEFTLEKLHLRDGENVVRLRREWMAMYELGELDLNGLRRVAPLLARAVEKKNPAR
jgi:hypothetical protein